MTEGLGGGEKLCPFCAEVIKAAAIKCKHCGEMLDAAVFPPAIPRDYPPKSGVIVDESDSQALDGLRTPESHGARQPLGTDLSGSDTSDGAVPPTSIDLETPLTPSSASTEPTVSADQKPAEYVIMTPRAMKRREKQERKRQRQEAWNALTPEQRRRAYVIGGIVVGVVVLLGVISNATKDKADGAKSPAMQESIDDTNEFHDLVQKAGIPTYPEGADGIAGVDGIEVCTMLDDGQRSSIGEAITRGADGGLTGGYQFEPHPWLSLSDVAVVIEAATKTYCPEHASDNETPTSGAEGNAVPTGGVSESDRAAEAVQSSWDEGPDSTRQTICEGWLAGEATREVVLNSYMKAFDEASDVTPNQRAQVLTAARDLFDRECS